MYLVERHVIKPSPQVIDLSVDCKELYNQALYYWRQTYFAERDIYRGIDTNHVKYFKSTRVSAFDFMNFCIRNCEDLCRALSSSTYQRTLALVAQDVKSYQDGLKSYKKDPKKFTGRPELPKYKRKLCVVTFTSNHFRRKSGMIHFCKKSGLNPVKTKVTEKIQQVRFIPRSNHFVMEVVYKRECQPKKQYNGKWLAIDIGVNNLATTTTRDSCVIFDGKPLKSINEFYNRKVASLRSRLAEQGLRTSKRMTAIHTSRSHKVSDYLHKTASMIVRHAVASDVTQIIIGKNKNWKQNVSLGKDNNRKFVQIPHARLIDMVTYKATLVGISTLTVNEAYTSRASALDYDDVKRTNFSGERVSRGLYVSKEGHRINADANASLNIARVGLSKLYHADSAKLQNNLYHEESPYTTDRVLSCVSQPARTRPARKRAGLKTGEQAVTA